MSVQAGTYEVYLLGVLTEWCTRPGGNLFIVVCCVFWLRTKYHLVYCVGSSVDGEQTRATQCNAVIVILVTVICARVDQEQNFVICSVGQCIKWLLQYVPDMFVAATVYWVD